MWNNVGMARNEAGLKEAIEKIQALKVEFWKNVYVAGMLAILKIKLFFCLQVFQWYAHYYQLSQ